MKVQVLQGRLGRTVSLHVKAKNGSAIGVLIILLIFQFNLIIIIFSP